MNRLKNTKVLVGIIIFLMLVNIATLSFLWFTRPTAKKERSDHKKTPDVERFLKRKLNLSDDQTRLFQEARDDHFAATQHLVKAMQKDRKELMKLLAQKPDSAEVNHLIRKMSRTQMDLERASFEHMQRLRSYCTEKQQPKFDSVMFNTVDRLGHHREKKRRRHRRTH